MPGAENGGARRRAPGRRALRRQPAVRRGDGQPPARGGHRRGDGAARARCSRCSRRGSTRSTAPERRLLQHGLGGRPDLLGGLAGADARPRRGSTCGARSASLEEKDLVVTSPGSRLAGEREYAFKHVLIRDVAYGMLPKAVRCRKHVEVGEFIARARRRPHRGLRRRWSPSTTRARRRSGRTAGLEPEELSRASAARRSELLEAAGDAAADALLERRGVRALLRPRSSSTDDARPGDRAADRREAGRRRPAAGPGGRGGRGLGAVPRVPPRRGGPGPGRATCTARSAPALWHKGERAASIDNYQRGIDLLKDGPPCIELVRLYEEAASLYMHTGDNMLAIYASEKALRLAERLGRGRARRAAPTGSSAASSAASATPRGRARTSSARSSWRASPTAARRSGRCSTLGYHLEVSEADYDGAAEAYREALDAGAGGRRPALAGRAARLARPARGPPRPTGTRSSARPRPAPGSPSARACTASSASPT